MMTVKSLLAENPDPSEADVRAALSSNLCRCTGYSQMYAAVRSAIAAEQQGDDCKVTRSADRKQIPSVA
jgi:carbon-monoxide dehydrogenase small subunit